MADYSIAQLAAAAQGAGFAGAALPMAVAVSLAENTGRSLHAVNVNTDGSRDRGPWQINDRWHPEVSDACAFSLDCSAAAAYRISGGGASWQLWSTFLSGRYKQFLGDAQAAAGGAVAAPGAAGALVDPLGPVGAAVGRLQARVVAGAQVLAGGALLVAGVVLVLVLVLGRSKLVRGMARG